MGEILLQGNAGNLKHQIQLQSILQKFKSYPRLSISTFYVLRFIQIECKTCKYFPNLILENLNSKSKKEDMHYLINQTFGK